MADGRFQRAMGLAAAGAVAFLTACGQQDFQEPRGGGYTAAPADTGSADDPSGTKPKAKSAYGKARERAERLVEEDVAEYNKKLEDAADGKF